jgi:acetyltransferase-like isoleucine patch superfamily enzyme
LKQKIIAFVKNDPTRIRQLLKIHNKTLGHNKIRIGRGNRIWTGSALLKRTSVLVYGVGNTIYIEDLSRLLDCRIYIRGNNNRMTIEKSVFLNEAELCIEDDDNTITIGEHTTIAGRTHLAAIEGTSIIIGTDCLFSSDIRFATGDSHSLTDLEGRRLNESESIVIGNHVWIGAKVICLKGVTVASNCMVGTGSLLNGRFEQENVVLAGNPARVLKSGINWLSERI